ncbi:DUF5606 domain-containing protein [Rubrolithibacter danxiaensis]|uniref:DUF5606 family protein n=1 Tax=Rubrolithibacter danxiaensis TaxID=3390805 RepID=UPI003BF903D1
MNLRGIVAVSGKPGLFKVIGQNKSGFVLESLDGQKLKLVVNLSTAKLASLEDITIFGEDDDLKLQDILEKMKSTSSIPEAKADGTTLRNFFREVAPDHDEEKVYSSDIKKIINWFNIIKDQPFFTENAEESAEEPVAEVQETVPAEETKTPAKAKRKKKAEE